MAAKKPAKSAKPVAAPAKVSDKTVVKTEVRNSPIPKASASKAVSPVAKKEISREMISQHAYFIWTREGGSEYDNWIRAERELRGL